MGITVNEAKNYTTDPDIVILSVAGSLDRNNLMHFKEQVNAYINQDRVKIILDFQQISFCDSTGLVGLLEIVNKTKELNGWLKVVSVPEKIRELILLLGLNTIIPIHQDVKDALAAKK